MRCSCNIHVSEAILWSACAIAVIYSGICFTQCAGLPWLNGQQTELVSIWYQCGDLHVCQFGITRYIANIFLRQVGIISKTCVSYFRHVEWHVYDFTTIQLQPKFLMKLDPPPPPFIPPLKFYMKLDPHPTPFIPPRKF